MRTNWMTFTARGTSLLWAGWWLFFGVASGIGEHEGAANLIVHILMPGGVALISALFAIRCQAAGGFLLLGEGFLLASIMALGVLNPANAGVAAFLTIS